MFRLTGGLHPGLSILVFAALGKRVAISTVRICVCESALLKSARKGVIVSETRCAQEGFIPVYPFSRQHFSLECFNHLFNYKKEVHRQTAYLFVLLYFSDSCRFHRRTHQW